MEKNSLEKQITIADSDFYLLQIKWFQMLMIKSIKNSNFLIYVIALFFILVIPSASAEDLQINDECIDDVITLTISDSDGPISGVSTYIYKDASMENFLERSVSDKTGKIKINFSDQTTMMKITKENHEDIIKNLVCNEEFRSQSMDVFSVVDSSIGIIEDPETKLTLVDLGTFYGIAGNGTIPDKIKVYRDNTLWKTTTKETGIAPSTSHSEWQLPQTFFFNELPGRYKLVLITNNTETLVYEFLVKQIVESEEKGLGINIDNNLLTKKEGKILNSRLSPIKQIANGISPENVTCKEGMQLVFKNIYNSPACVKPVTVDKLIERGWINS